MSTTTSTSGFGTLGCAERYDAVLHWQGGKRKFASLEGIVEVSWSRKLGDFSEAHVRLAKGQMSRACWSQITPKWDADGTLLRPGVEPWAHELSIYRDGGLVWQGPVVTIVESKDLLEIDARDVLAWMDRRVVDLNLSGGSPDGDKFRGQTGLVLRNIVERTWPGTHESNPYDNPGITEHAEIHDTPDRFTETERIWKGSRTVGDLVRDVIKNGIDLYTVGRKVVASPDYVAINRQPYRLTEDHIVGDLEIRRLGLDMCTEGFALGQAEGLGTNAAPVFGKWPTEEGPGGPGNPSTPAFFGRITRFTQSQSLAGPPPPPPAPAGPDGQPPPPPPPPQNPSPALQQVAATLVGYGFPCPAALVVPDHAQLAAHAPITINQLVPGRCVNVELTSYVNKTQDIYRINEVQVTWTASSNSSSGSSESSSGSSSTGSSSAGSGSTSSSSSTGSSGSSSSGNSEGLEKIQVGLVTLRKPPVPPENEQSSSTSSSSGSASSAS